MSLAHVFLDALFGLVLFSFYQTLTGPQPSMSWGAMAMLAMLSLVSLLVLFCGSVALRPEKRERWRVHGLEKQWVQTRWQMRVHILLLVVTWGIAFAMDARRFAGR